MNNHNSKFHNCIHLLVHVFGNIVIPWDTVNSSFWMEVPTDKYKIYSISFNGTSKTRIKTELTTQECHALIHKYTDNVFENSGDDIMYFKYEVLFDMLDNGNAYRRHILTMNPDIIICPNYNRDFHIVSHMHHNNKQTTHVDIELAKEFIRFYLMGNRTI